jgi:signal transduction histidine kinase
MRERVEHLGGEFHIQSQPGHGTLVDVQLPLLR